MWAGELEVLAPASLIALINHFKGTQVLTQPVPELQPEPAAPLDLADIKGQESAKRALEIAAAGGHNLLMIGPPGSGKSMLAARLPGLLPPLEPAEALEVSMIHSVAGLLDGGRLMRRRLFAIRIIPPRRRRWSAVGCAHDRARSAWRIVACCSSTSCPSSPLLARSHTQTKEFSLRIKALGSTPKKSAVRGAPPRWRRRKSRPDRVGRLNESLAAAS